MNGLSLQVHILRIHMQLIPSAPELTECGGTVGGVLQHTGTYAIVRQMWLEIDAN